MQKAGLYKICRFYRTALLVLIEAMAAACHGKPEIKSLYEGPITDPKLREACLRQADQLMTLLIDENFVIPDRRGKPPEKIELDHVFDTYPFQTFTVQWPELELTLRTDGGLAELRRRTPPRPPDPPRPVATTQTQVNDTNGVMTAQLGVGRLGEMNAALAPPPHVAPKQSITTGTAHRQCLGLLKRLMPLTWQQYDKMRWTRPEEDFGRGEVSAMTGYINFLGSVNGLPCDEKSVHFTVNYTSNTLEYFSITDIPGIYPSVQDQKISAEDGARIAMEYLGKGYGKKAQMEATHHILKLSCVDRPDGGPSIMKFKSDYRHPRLVHWYKIWSQSLPPDKYISGYWDYVTVDAISGIVLDHSHIPAISGPPGKDWQRNFFYRRFPDKK